MRVGMDYVSDTLKTRAEWGSLENLAAGFFSPKWDKQIQGVSISFLN